MGDTFYLETNTLWLFRQCQARVESLKKLLTVSLSVVSLL